MYIYIYEYKYLLCTVKMCIYIWIYIYITYYRLSIRYCLLLALDADIFSHSGHGLGPRLKSQAATFFGQPTFDQYAINRPRATEAKCRHCGRTGPKRGRQNKHSSA